MTSESPIVEDVRDRAMRISERFQHDVHKYCAHLREKEKEHPHRVVSQITVVGPSETLSSSDQ
jgi:hypothetical protein